MSYDQTRGKQMSETSERDELAALIEATFDDVPAVYDALTDAILTAGYRKPRQVTIEVKGGAALAACPPRVEGAKPHCPDCAGIVGEAGIV